MGEYLIVHHNLLDDLMQISLNAMSIYLMLLKRVSFKFRSRDVINNSNMFAYSFSTAQKDGYKKTKTHFHRGISELEKLGYLGIVTQGNFRGKKQNILRLKKF